MLIIVEGPDGSGKTTLINELCEQYGFEKMPSVPREWPLNYHIWDTFIKSILNKQLTYIIDRSFISEWIYRILKHDKIPNVDLTQISFLTSNKLIFVFCDTENSFKLSLERGEDYITTDNEHKLLKTYYDFVKNTLRYFTPSVVIDYDFTYKSVEDVYNEIQEVLND